MSNQEQPPEPLCPFCGWPPCPRQDIYTRCSNRKCPVYKTAFTHDEWNTRATPTAERVKELEDFVRSMYFVREKDAACARRLLSLAKGPKECQP